MNLPPVLKTLSFNRNEWSGAFGDIGTDFPLIAGLILTGGLNVAGVLVLFGFFQIITAIAYRMPMPVQPLKAMITIVLAQRLDPQLLYGGGLAIGIAMLLLTVTGSLRWLASHIPRSVVRGIQFGLGLSLAQLALRNYLPSDALTGYLLGAVGFVIILSLLGNTKYPPALWIIFLGISYAVLFKDLQFNFIQNIRLTLPRFHIPPAEDILSGFVVLALPQIPLSLGNSIFAAEQTIKDLFPEKSVTLRKIGLTYSAMNLISPFFGGIPTCHGSGGMAGHYIFGGRTGGSVMIYGSFYLVLGFFFSQSANEWIRLFPLPLLGVLLFFEALAMMMLVKDMTSSKTDLFIVLTVGTLILTLPYGYLIGMIAGTLMHKFMPKGNYRVDTP